MMSSFRSARRTPRDLSRSLRAAQCAVEAMEARRLLSVSIHGTSGDDTISVAVGTGGALMVNANGMTTTYTPAQYAGGISIDTGAAHTADTLTIAGLPAVQTTVVSGALLKATLGTDGRGLQDIAATGLRVGGATGVLQLTLNDSSDATARRLTLGTATDAGVAYDVLHGLTPGDIRSAGSLLVVNLGNAGNTLDVNGTAPAPNPVPTFAIVNLNIGNGDDTVNISATGAGTILNINGQAGHDQVNITDPTAGVQNIHGVVNVSNPLGQTSLSIDDTADRNSRALSLNAFTAGGATYGALAGLAPAPIDFAGAQMQHVEIVAAPNQLNSLVVSNTPGGGTIEIWRLATADVLGTAAGQTLNLFRQFEIVPYTQMTVDFSTGRIGAHSQILADCEILDVIGSSPSDRFAGPFVRVADGSSVGFEDEDIDVINFSQGSLTAPILDDRPVGLNLGPSASVTFTGGPFDALGSLSISSGSSLTLSPSDLSNFPNGLTVYGQLSVEGKLDVTNNTLDLRDVTLTQVRDLVRQGLGRSFGITSSAADASHNLGYRPNPAGSGVQVQWTLYGDANLDGKVDFNDLLILAQNYGRDEAFWDQGDFNYDGRVNFADALRLAQNYGKRLGWVV